MSIFRNSRGQWFRSGLAGCYEINNGDPQCADDEFDEDRAQTDLDEAMENAAERAQENDD